MYCLCRHRHAHLIIRLLHVLVRNLNKIIRKMRIERVKMSKGMTYPDVDLLLPHLLPL
jgi:hypothetical protein